MRGAAAVMANGGDSGLRRAQELRRCMFGVGDTQWRRGFKMEGPEALRAHVLAMFY
jgi:hypothetical protein